MRNLNDVITKLVELANNEEFENIMNSISTSVTYSAPENMPLWWEKTHDVILQYCLPLKYKWQADIISEFSTTQRDILCKSEGKIYEELEG